MPRGREAWNWPAFLTAEAGAARALAPREQDPLARPDLRDEPRCGACAWRPGGQQGGLWPWEREAIRVVRSSVFTSC